MSIINQALQKAQREQLKHTQQETPHRVPTLPARAPRRRWLVLPLGCALLVGLGVLRALWPPQPPGALTRQTAPAVPPAPMGARASIPPAPAPPTSALSEAQIPLEAAAPAFTPPARLEAEPLPASSRALRSEDVPIRTALTPAALNPPPAPPAALPLPAPTTAPMPDVASPETQVSVETVRAQVLLQRGLEAQEAGALPRALTLLEQAVKLDPTAKAAYNSLGNVYYQQRRYQQALAMYQKALAIDPDYAKAHNNLGSTYMQLAMDAQAIEALQQALRADSSYSLAYYNLACVYARSGDSATAAQYLQQAIALEPQARTWAQTDSDFARVRMAPAMQQLLGP